MGFYNLQTICKQKLNSLNYGFNYKNFGEVKEHLIGVKLILLNQDIKCFKQKNLFRIEPVAAITDKKNQADFR